VALARLAGAGAMSARRLFCIACGVLALAGCGGVPLERYRGEEPVLDLAEYFNGTIDGWGMFQDRSGQVIKRFHVVIDARWVKHDGVDVGTLDENFSWSDGSTSRRLWTITRTGPGQYLGRADDVVGDARGEAMGNALRWQYVLALPVDGRVWHVDFDDWMFLIDDRIMLNRAQMSKFGFHLGEVTLSFSKR